MLHTLEMQHFSLVLSAWLFYLCVDRIVAMCIIYNVCVYS